MQLIFILNLIISFFLLKNKHFSTSPEQEPADFVKNFKQSLRIMIEHPKPLKTYFINQKPKIYYRLEGKIEWIPIDK